MKTQVIFSVFTALGASICCITPVLTIAAGTSSLASTFTWIEPFRPYLISSTVFILGFAWFKAFKTKKEDECGCEQKTSFVQSKKFLGIITFFALLLISFPSYSKFFINKESALASLQQEKNKRVELAVKGMTCASCELHIESEVKKIPGVSFVRASYDQGSTIVEFDEKKVDTDKIIAAINGTGYKVEGSPSSALLQGKENCTASSCQVPVGDLPKEANKDLIVLNDVNQIQKAFNQSPEKTKFVAILSSTCKWCLQGAESVQKAVIENMAKKNLSVIIVWTNMLQSDGEQTAFRAASLFKSKNIVQFFDAENKFGDVAAKAISPSGEQAWDIYMFFDKDAQWKKNMPRPFEYAHQLGQTRTWVDQTKYFCGNKLTERLEFITKSL
jgi:mercuric ion transport protein